MTGNYIDYVNGWVWAQ